MLETVDDGDCGVDVLNLIVGVERQLEVREALRLELAGFLLKHVGNRALIAMLFDLGEVAVHLGRVELETEAAKLLNTTHHTHHGDGRGDALVHGEHDTHHGEDDGVALAHGDGAPCGPSAVVDRIFSVEEVNAVKWKCQLYKSSPECVQRLLSALPVSIIEYVVQEHQHQDAPQQPKRHTVFSFRAIVR